MSLNRNKHTNDPNSFKNATDLKLSYWFANILGKDPNTNTWSKAVKKSDDFGQAIQNITASCHGNTTALTNWRYLTDLHDAWKLIKEAQTIEQIVHPLLKLHKKYTDESLNGGPDNPISREMALQVQHFLLLAINLTMITGTLKDNVKAQFKAAEETRAQQNPFAFYAHPPKQKQRTEAASSQMKPS